MQRLTRISKVPQVGEWIKATSKRGRVFIITGKIIAVYLGGFELLLPDGLKRYVTYEHFDIDLLEVQP